MPSHKYPHCIKCVYVSCRKTLMVSETNSDDSIDTLVINTVFLSVHFTALEQIGSIPFDILKPVLQLASPEQLFTIESYNPYLMEDTDMLWEFHGKRKFRNNKRLELETWREMFLVSTKIRLTFCVNVDG